MFSNEYFYKITDRKYRRRDKKYLPKVIYDDLRLNTPEYFYEKAIRNIARNQILDTPQNREWCFWTEGIAQAFAYIIANTITGTGVRVKCSNEKALKVIKKFNERVNSFGQTIEDAITDWVIDNIVHGFAAWRILITDELETNVDISRMNPKTLVLVSHSRQGWTKYIQYAPVDDMEPQNKSAFLKSYKPSIDPQNGTYYPLSNVYQYAHIPIESTVSINLFKKPPITPALTLIVFKKWIVLFMRKAAEKFWSPTIWAKMGTEENHPLDVELYEERMDEFTKELANWSIFKGIVTPFDVDIKPIELKNAGVDYVRYLEYLDSQIVQYLLASTGLTEAKGKDLATSRTNNEVFLRTIQAHRHKIGVALRRFYNEILLPYNGISAQDDLEIDWSHLKESSDVEYISMCAEAFKIGIFKDYGELTKAAKAVWPWIEERSGDDPPEYLKKFSELGSLDKSVPTKKLGNTDLSDRNRPAEKAGPKGDRAAEPH
ncbi:MAG: phage portal protein family protein [Candidatus Helarchaeales archaeon]